MIYRVDFFSLCDEQLIIYVDADSMESAILVANKQKALERPNFVMGNVFAKELSIVKDSDFDDIKGYENFNKVVANFDDIGEVIFDNNTEFREYCETRDIYYIFDDNRMLKDNKAIGWFYCRYQRVDVVEVEHYNSNNALKGAQ